MESENKDPILLRASLEKLMKSNSHIRNDLLIKNFLIQLCNQATTS